MNRVIASRIKNVFPKKSQKEFHKKFKSDVTVNPLHAIPLFKDITKAENKSLTLDVSNEKIFEAVKQISPFKAQCPDFMQVIFYQKNIIDKFVAI